MWTVKRIKLFRLLYTRSLCGQPIKASSEIIGIDSDGCPKSLHFLKELWTRRDTQSIRFMLTLLSVSRAMAVSAKKVDISSIIDTFTGTDMAPIPNSFIEKWSKDNYVFLCPENFEAGKVSFNYFSTKAGPMGLATATAWEHLQTLSENVLGAIGVLASDKLIIEMTNIWHRAASVVGPNLFSPPKKGVREVTNRRLSVVNDPEGKSRVIAIFDYWSQASLRGLHKDLLDLLRGLKPDRTFTQDPYIDPPNEGHHYHSLDLSAATDRYPRAQTSKILEIIWGKGKGVAWEVAMTYEKFLIDTKLLGAKKSSTKQVSYAVGQPMGAYSSWAAFTVSHHITVQYAAFLVGKYPFKGYILLGDDIVINDDNVAAKYCELMSAMGVEISPMKTHVSKDTYEFAKRWFHKGVEVTGISLRSILTTHFNPLLLLSTIQSMYRKGQIPLVPTNIPCLIHGLLELLCREGDNHVGLFNPAGLRRNPRLLTKALRSLTNTHKLFRLVNAFNADEAREFMCSLVSRAQEIPEYGEVALPSCPTMLEKCFSRVVGIALGDHASTSIDKFCSIAESFSKKFRERLVNTCQVLQDMWYLYDFHPVYWGLLSSIVQQNKADRLFNQTEDLKGAIPQVIIPDAESSFDKRKEVQLLRSYTHLGKAFEHYVQKDFHSSIALGTSTRLSQSWAKAMADFKILGLSPLDRNQMLIQSAQAELFI